MESNKKMRPALKITIAFLIVAALLTVLSKTLYNMNIPTVTVSKIVSGSLRKSYETQGIISPKSKVGVYVDEPLKVLKLSVEKGDKVRAGDVVAELDVSPLKIELAEQTAECERLSYNLKNTRGKEARRIAELDVEAAEMKRDATEARIEQYQRLTAPVDGTVTEVNVYPGMYTGMDSAILEIAEDDTGYVVYIVMDSKTATDYAVGDSVSVEELGGWTNIKGKINDMTADTSGSVSVKVGIEGGVSVGGIVSLRFSKTTVAYECLVPIDTIVDETYVYVIDESEGILGAETYMRRVRVTIKDTDSESVAVTGDFEGSETVVTGSSGEYTNGRVKIREEI